MAGKWLGEQFVWGSEELPSDWLAATAGSVAGTAASRGLSSGHYTFHLLRFCLDNTTTPTEAAPPSSSTSSQANTTMSIIISRCCHISSWRHHMHAWQWSPSPFCALVTIREHACCFATASHYHSASATHSSDTTPAPHQRLTRDQPPRGIIYPLLPQPPPAHPPLVLLIPSRVMKCSNRRRRRCWTLDVTCLPRPLAPAPLLSSLPLFYPLLPSLLLPAIYEQEGSLGWSNFPLRVSGDAAPPPPLASLFRPPSLLRRCCCCELVLDRLPWPSWRWRLPGCWGS